MKAINQFKLVFQAAITNNSTFIMLLGLCSVLAASNSFSTSIGMGVAVTLVIIVTNMLVSSIRKITPEEIRIPVYIVLIAAVVTMIQMLMKAYTPQLAMSLGVYLPLIVVNCIIMARAEVFASKNTVMNSFFDGLGTGLGYLLAIIAISLVREIFGTGALSFVEPFGNTTVFSFRIFDPQWAIGLFISPTGAFLSIGLIIALINVIAKRKEA
jgi:Na+-translocating ferredoxin:NAD+ oxidoreductase subunit E